MFLYTGCRDGYYGSSCTTPCGKCTTGDVCNDVTGNCPSDCQAGWQQPMCNQRKY